MPNETTASRALRDYFAAHALATIDGQMPHGPDGGSIWLHPTIVASRAYAIADAMLLERERAAIDAASAQQEDKSGANHDL